LPPRFQPDAVTSIEGLPFPLLASDKVREIYDLGDALLLVAPARSASRNMRIFYSVVYLFPFINRGLSRFPD